MVWFIFKIFIGDILLMLIDSREQEMIGRVSKKAEENGIPYEVQEMEIGDYMFITSEYNICIERKKIGDLIISKRSGRLDNQLKRMNANFPFSYLLVVGKFENIYLSDKYIKGWTVEHTLGLYSSISAKYPYIHIVPVANDSQSINFMFMLYKKFEEHKEIRTASDIELKFKKQRIKDINPNYVHYCQIAGIGEKKAKEILQEYPKFSDFYEDFRNECLKIKISNATKEWLKRMC